MRSVENDALARYAEVGLGTFVSTTRWDRRADVLAVLGTRWPLRGVAVVVDLGGTAHLELVAVRRSSQGEGLGTALVEAATEVAAGWGATRMTTSTYADVAFNAPWFVARGFTVVSPARWTDAERTLVAEERAASLHDGARRVLLERQLDSRSERALDACSLAHR